ncbi:barstar family protein [Eggerthia catenaformis]|mgnify:CR=1 FL=1|uniref:barstar family protein n=1 Tax=Eggerthia catenaformis TaxID=31973 RepID=UPI0028E292D0|nr:barstar family protein [Eggerthia catenaformis]
MDYIVDLKNVCDEKEFHQALTIPLPDYYGNNLDALYDVMTSYDKPVKIIFINTCRFKKKNEEFVSLFLNMCDDVTKTNENIEIFFCEGD